MKTIDVLAAYRRHGAPYQTESLLNLVVDGAAAATLHCADGRRLIDLASGDFGHAHPVVQDAVIAQVLRGPLSSRVLINRGLAELSIRLAEWTPGDLEVSYVCNSGEEALDSALKLAKGRWPKRKGVVVCRRADYGTLSHGVRFAGMESRFLSTLAFEPVPVRFGDTDIMEIAIDHNTAAVLLEPFIVFRS
jgi:acetylornithine/succinyldiaminopimelate/putrescine aminotransferase